MMLLYVAASLKPMREYGLWAGCGVSPAIFVFLVNEQLCQLVLAGGALVLFSGAPYRSQMDSYLLPRAGRVSLALGNCLYILCAAIVYVAALFAFELIGLAGALDWGNGWGKLLRSVAAGVIPDNFASQFLANASIIRLYEAGPALALTLSLEVLCVAFLGLTVYVGNRAFQRPVGLWLGGAFVMLDITIYNMLADWWNVISPLAMPRLSTYSYRYYLPLNGTPAYGYLALGVGIALLIVCALLEETLSGRAGRLPRKKG